MALICASCGTENRAVARFCIECIGALQPDFEPTQVLSRRAPPQGTTLMGMPTALAEFAAAPAPVPPAPTAPPRKASSAEPRKGLWLSVAAFAITLVVGAGGWMIAGAGGWYIYSATTTTVPDAAAPALVSSALPQAQAAVPLIPVADPAPPAPLPIAAAPSAVQPAVVPGPAPAAPPPTRAPVIAKARLAAPATRSAVGKGDPLAPCAELGFLARSRCVAAQCARTEFRGAPACQSVLAQQRLMEEKRNPLLAN